MKYRKHLIIIIIVSSILTCVLFIPINSVDGVYSIHQSAPVQILLSKAQAANISKDIDGPAVRQLVEIPEWSRKIETFLTEEIDMHAAGENGALANDASGAIASGESDAIASSEKDEKDSAEDSIKDNENDNEKDNEDIEALLRSMTVDEKLGQLIIIRLPDRMLNVDGRAESLINELLPGGFIVFGENVQSIEQVRSLTSGIQQMAKIPLFIAVDEEGGRVSRIGRLYDEKHPSAISVGQTENPDYAYLLGRNSGRRLADLGINMNFAPVADIWTNPVNSVIGDRAFGTDQNTAAIMVEAVVEGIKDEGVLSVIKHFPGHGDTVEDSHNSIATYTHGRARFDAVEAAPFLSGFKAGVDGVIVGHIATPLIQNGTPVLDWMAPWHSEGRLPATFSDYWLRDYLRDEIHYNGLIITDSLEMRAITDNFSAGQTAVGAFLAGADILLLPKSPKEAIDALRKAYESGLISDERLDASIRRVLKAKQGMWE
jgi:beta-N-acetylhexosaminidase